MAARVGAGLVPALRVASAAARVAWAGAQRRLLVPRFLVRNWAMSGHSAAGGKLSNVCCFAQRPVTVSRVHSRE